MDRELSESIRSNLEAKSSDELRQAYRTHDEAAWSPEALEAMRAILIRRGETDPGPLPFPPRGTAVDGARTSAGRSDTRFRSGWIAVLGGLAVMVFGWCIGMYGGLGNAGPGVEDVGIAVLGAGALVIVVGALLLVTGWSDRRAGQASQMPHEKRQDAPPPPGSSW